MGLRGPFYFKSRTRLRLVDQMHRCQRLRPAKTGSEKRWTNRKSCWISCNIHTRKQVPEWLNTMPWWAAYSLSMAGQIKTPKDSKTSTNWQPVSAVAVYPSPVKKRTGLWNVKLKIQCLWSMSCPWWRWSNRRGCLKDSQERSFNKLKLLGFVS